jgi:hypothetical protein
MIALDHLPLITPSSYHCVIKNLLLHPYLVGPIEDGILMLLLVSIQCEIKYNMLE